MGRDWHHRLAAAKADLGRVAISPEYRAALERRQADLRGSLSHRDPGRVKSAISTMIATFRVGALDRDEARFIVESYTRALGDLPAWAVIEACGVFARGGGPSDKHPPAAAELHRSAADRISVFEREGRAVEAILAGPLAIDAIEPQRPTLEELQAKNGGADWGISSEASSQRAKAKADQTALLVRANTEATAGADEHGISPLLAARLKEMTAGTAG